MKNLFVFVLCSCLVNLNAQAAKLNDILNALEAEAIKSEKAMQQYEEAERSRKTRDTAERLYREERWFNQSIAPQFPQFVNDRYSQTWKDYIARPLNDGTNRRIGHKLADARKVLDTQIAISVIGDYYNDRASSEVQRPSMPVATDGLRINVLSPTNVQYDTYYQDFVETFPKIAKEFNSRFTKLRPAVLEARECGGINAFYTRSTRTVTMCYEMANAVGHRLSERYETSTNLPKFHRDWTLFILFHEIGHMLLDGKAALGREEDNADLIAVYLLPQRSMQAALLAGIEFHAPRSIPSLRAYADSHSVDGSRRVNIACWLYGKEPALYKDMLPVFTSIGMTPDRLQKCSAEYKKQSAALFHILESYK